VGEVTDLALQLWVGALVEWSRVAHVFRGSPPWKPGAPLELLFAGYNGARNTGSDVRVEEMIRQIRRILGPERVRCSVLTQDFALTRGYFGGAEQLKLPDVFPPFLHRTVPRFHGVIACEGSMFKSRFADALSAMMAQALGTAAARNRLSVGYGAEAGEMSPTLRALVRRTCGSTLVIARNEESEHVLRTLEIQVEPGTDTAWTFEPLPAAYGESKLREAGWDGRTPILAIAAIHPFWWPVKASLVKAAANRLFGAHQASHYRSVYFHASGRAVEQSFRAYVNAIAGGVESFRARHNVFPVLVAMERLDTRACERVALRLGGAPIFSSRDFTMHELVSILRASHLLLSSRYHGIVTTMPALIPSAGVTMDERIRNLLTDRGHADLVLEASDPELEGKIDGVLERLWIGRDEIRLATGRAVVSHLRRMAKMGAIFETEVARRYPEFPVRGGVVAWEDYLPPLSPAMRHLVDEFGEEVAAPRPPRRVPIQVSAR
jgi:polysaccharide pyruvyl transferase WcaK-like protein